MSFEEGDDEIIANAFERSISSNVYVQNNVLLWSSKLSWADYIHIQKTIKEGLSHVPGGFLKRWDLGLE